MMRLLMLLVVLLTVAIVMPGCEESGSSAAAEMGVQDGQRPKSREQRPPPGPQQGSFQEGEGDQIPSSKPDEPSDD